MIQIIPQIHILIATGPVDFRKGIDGLTRVCKSELAKDPFSGSMFIFRNKRRTTLKILIYDGQGFWLFIKRLSKGKFNWWPSDAQNTSLTLSAAELNLLIWNGDPKSAIIGPDWKEIKK